MAGRRKEGVGTSERWDVQLEEVLAGAGGVVGEQVDDNVTCFAELKQDRHREGV